MKHYITSKRFIQIFIQSKVFRVCFKSGLSHLKVLNRGFTDIIWTQELILVFQSLLYFKLNFTRNL